MAARALELTLNEATLIYPSTPEGLEALNKRLERFNGVLLGMLLKQTYAPCEAKIAYINSLGGVAPWKDAEIKW